MTKSHTLARLIHKSQNGYGNALHTVRHAEADILCQQV